MTVCEQTLIRLKTIMKYRKIFPGSDPTTPKSNQQTGRWVRNVWNWLLISNTTFAID